MINISEFAKVELIVILVNSSPDVRYQNTVNERYCLVWYLETTVEIIRKIRPCPACSETTIYLYIYIYMRLMLVIFINEDLTQVRSCPVERHTALLWNELP